MKFFVTTVSDGESLDVVTKKSILVPKGALDLPLLEIKMSKLNIRTVRSNRPEVLLRKRVLKICSKFIGEHPCRSAISIKLLSNFILKLHFGMGVLL